MIAWVIKIKKNREAKEFYINAATETQARAFALAEAVETGFLKAKVFSRAEGTSDIFRGA
jgi:hypothetical protein